MHEYGGKSYLAVPSLSLAGGFDLVFANFADQRLYAVGGGGRGGHRAGAADARRGRLPLRRPGALPDGQEIWCVRETVLPLPATAAAGRLPRRRRRGGAPGDRRGAARRVGRDDAAAIRVLVSGAQFFAFPTPSPDGTKLAWISWNHPNMPWDGTELRVGPVSGGTLDVARRRAGHGRARRVGARPAWRDDATLYVISDASGWWNLYEVRRRRRDAAAAAPARRGIRRAAVAARRAAVRAAERRPARGAARPRRVPARRARPGLRGTDRPRPARLPHRRRGTRRLRHRDHHGGGRPAHPVERAAHHGRRTGDRRAR